MKYIIAVVYFGGQDREMEVSAKSEKEAYRLVWNDLRDANVADNIESLEIVDEIEEESEYGSNDYGTLITGEGIFRLYKNGKKIPIIL